MIPHKIFFTSKLRSISEIKLWFALEKLDEHTVMLSEMCHGQLHGWGTAPVTVAPDMGLREVSELQRKAPSLPSLTL